MVVDDDELIGLALTHLLTRGGHEVFGPYETAEDTLGALSAHEVDLAIVDVNLRGGGANTVASELRAARIPFIAFTGGTKTLEGAVMMVSKPIDPATLLQTVDDVV